MDTYNIRQTIPFFMVKDIHRSLQFYVDGLGFQVLNTWAPNGKLTWCSLRREGAAMMLQEYDSADARFHVDKGIGVSLCFQCVDALSLYHEFISKGLKPQEPFVGNNMWDVALNDPDNYSIHFESPTGVPEETTYTEWRAGKDR